MFGHEYLVFESVQCFISVAKAVRSAPVLDGKR